MKFCPKCKKEFSDNQGFCGDCGVKLESKPQFCVKCGSKIEVGQHFCGSCGTEVISDNLTSFKNNAVKAGKALHTVSQTLSNSETFKKTKEHVSAAFSAENINNIKTQIQNVTDKGKKSFSFDLIKMFPTSDEQYSAFYKLFLMYCIIISLTSLLLLAPLDDNNPLYLILGLSSLLISLVVIYVYIYLFFKVGIFKILLRILGGLLLSLCVMAFIGGSTAGIGALILVGLSIYTNRKRSDFVKKFERYIWKPIVLAMLAGGISCLIFYFIFTLKRISDPLVFVSIFAPIFLVCNFALVYRFFWRQEQAKGISFMNFQRLMWLVPLTFFMLIFSFLTMFHVFDVAGDGSLDNLLDDPNLVPDAGNLAAGVESIDTPVSSVPDNVDNNIPTATGITNEPPMLTVHNGAVYNSEGVQVGVIGVQQNYETNLNPSPTLDSEPTSKNVVENIRITDADGKSAITVKDNIIENSEGLQIGKMNVQGNSIVAEDMSGMTVGSTDGQFVYDEVHKPTAVVDHNADVTTVHHSDGSITNEHGGDIIDGKTGKVVGRIENI